MDWERIIAAPGPVRVLAAVGALFVAVAAIAAGRILIDGSTVASGAVNFTLISGPGVVLLYGAYRLPRTGIDAAVYPRVVRWTLGGVAVLLGIVGLLIVDPGGTINRPLNAAAQAAGIGAVGGFLVGVNQARAITRAREAERRNRELERTQAKLRDTVDRLEASNERLEQFAYAASHDLQEPLRMVSSYLQLIEDRYGDDLDEDGREFIEFAVDGADRMRDMIAGLLQYSRIESRSDPLEPVDLDGVLADARADLQVKVEESDAEITADPLPTVEGDGDQLRQVFQNLLSNAIEYSGDEPPRIHVAAERAGVSTSGSIEDSSDGRSESDGAEWVVSVEDEGVGIDLDRPDRVFEVFQSFGTDGVAGSGIGLALCQRIVERHGGDIWVESEPGEGATFSFSLPPADGEQDSGAADRARQ